MSPDELAALKEELEFLVRQGRIRPSSSNYGAPVFYVRQKGKLRLVIDYRLLNDNTIKTIASIPNMQEMFDQLRDARYLSKADLASGYHQIRVAEDDIHKTAFRTKYGLFEWVVMPFGLSNAPATFQGMMNTIFSDMIDKFVIIYLDDILIYSKTYEEHISHLEQVLQRLKDNKLHCRVTKCQFLRNEIDYLGFLIKNGTVSVLPDRVQAIQDFERPTSWTDLRSFCGLANTIHRFISRHAEILAPLTSKFKGFKRTTSGASPPFTWTDKDEQAFSEVKKRLTDPDQLHLFDPNKPVHLYTDWSEHAIGSYVAQPDDNGIDQPVAYASRKCNDAERKYHPYMGEILALVEALRTHRHYLLGRNVKAFTDHRSLQHILTQPKLRPVQLRWLADILTYDFQIQWQPGEWNTVADALSRRRHTQDRGTNTTQLNAITEITNDMLDDIRDMSPDDAFYKQISQYLEDPQNPNADEPEPIPNELNTQVRRYLLRDQLLYYRDKDHLRLYVPVPLRNQIMRLAHDDGPSIHNNWERTFERITRFYHWPKLHKDIFSFVQRCDSCQRNKVARRLPYGLLQPHEVPLRRWETVSMDFVGPLPATKNGYDFIMTVVDYASKRVHLIPCQQTSTSKDVARLFELHVWRNHGLPTKLITDRDVRFCNNFWSHLMSSLKIQSNTSTAYHPQTNGNTEMRNGWMANGLRHFTNYYQDNWDDYLHIVEYGINDTRNSSTGYTPFYLDTGQHPKSILDLALNPYDSLQVRDMQAAYKVARQRIQEAQDTYAAQANKHRLDDPFKPGDLVLLSTKDFLPPNLRHRPSVKLQPKYSGPYKIEAQVGTSYRLALPANWAVHNVFHPEKLRKYYWDTEGPHPLSALPLATRTIDDVLATRVLRRGNRHFHQALIKWRDHNPTFNVWLDLDANLREQIRRSLPDVDLRNLLRDRPPVHMSINNDHVD